MPIARTAEGPKFGHNANKNCLHLYSVFFPIIGKDWGEDTVDPPSPRPRSAGPGWYHKSSSSPVTEGFRTMHPTLKPCYRALGTKGAGVNCPPQILAGREAKPSTSKSPGLLFALLDFQTFLRLFVAGCVAVDLTKIRCSLN